MQLSHPALVVRARQRLRRSNRIRKPNCSKAVPLHRVFISAQETHRFYFARLHEQVRKIGPNVDLTQVAFDAGAILAIKVLHPSLC